MKQGSIVVLPIPFTDLSSAKQRPCLVLSNNCLKSSQDVIVLALTSQEKAATLPHSVQITSQNLTTGKLPKTSYARCHKVFCIQKKLVRKSVGELSPKLFGTIQSEFLKIVR